VEVVLVLSGLLVGFALGFWIASRRRDGAVGPATGSARGFSELQLRTYDTAPEAGVAAVTPSSQPLAQAAAVAVVEPGDVPTAVPPEPAPEAGHVGPSVEELRQQELERLQKSCSELGARAEELESQARRMRRWAGAQLQRSTEQLEALWKREKLPTRVHEMSREPVGGVMEQVRELAEPLGEWSDELGLGGADVSYWMGLWHALEGRPTAAVEGFEQALRKGIEGEKRRETQLALGDALWLLDRRKKARDAYRQVLDRKRLPGVVLHRCAQVAFEERSYAEALSLLESILERKQTPLQAFTMASLAAAKLGDHAKAVALCEAGLKRFPDTPILLTSMLVPLGQLGQRERMQEVCARARELDPKLAEAPFSIAVVRLHDNDLDGAGELLNEALGLRPDYPEALFCLGVICNRRGEFRKALEYFRRAVALKPDYAEAYYNMKDSYDGLRDFESSIAMLKKAVQLNPEYR